MAHMHYKGTGKVHSFRGLLVDGGQDKISIQGSVGAIAWRITKFELIGYNPSATANESTVKVWREEQGVDDGSGDPYKFIDFQDNELLAAAYYSGAAANSQPQDVSVIFDNALFSRNIYLTHFDGSANVAINYYIELEEVKVGKSGMAQLALAAARRVQTDV